MAFPPPPRGSIVVHAQYRVVTPAFIRGADQSKAELRTASFKGVLRFWWRALYWAKALTQAQNDVVRALALLHAQEALLFGLASSSSDRTSGQGLIRQIQLNALLPLPGRPVHTRVGPAEAYLLGQGLAENLPRNEATKSETAKTKSAAIGSGATLALTLLFDNSRIKSQTHEGIAADFSSVVEALKVLGLTGGFGSRSRKGFGSLALMSLTQNGLPVDLPGNTEELEAELEKLSADAAHVKELPPFTAFSAGGTCFALEASSLQELRGHVGAEMMRYRSIGRELERGAPRVLQLRHVNGRPEWAESNFEDDHLAMGSALHGDTGYALPRRVAFGLPHNYRFSNGGKVSINAVLPGSTNTSATDRRASPLFIHFHQFPDGKHCGVLAYLPAVFLPVGAKVSVAPQGARPKIFAPPSLDSSNEVIPAFLNRF